MLALALLLVAAPSLDKGDVIVTTRAFPDSPIPEATVKAVVSAPPELVWKIVSDCANYKDTMPSIASSVQVKSEKPSAADGDTAVEVKLCRVVASLPIPFPNLTSVTRGVHLVDPGKRWERKWKLVEGDYLKNEGSWIVEPYAGGSKSLVTYIIEAQPKIALPDWLVASAEQSKLPDMMKNIREKAAARLAQAPAPTP
ncbi:MAG TPA: SRPBCC family protein [Myxococcota bacterium]